MNGEEDYRPHPADDDSTQVLRQFGAPWAGEADRAPVMDVPAEDGGDGSGSWAWKPSNDLLSAEAAAASAFALRPGAALPPDPVPLPGTPSERARWNLENGGSVVDGPWTVRQMPYGPDGLAMAAADLVDALTRLREPFFMEAWWANEDTHLVRITWGSLLGLAAEELGAMVESWPGA